MSCHEFVSTFQFKTLVVILSDSFTLSLALLAGSAEDAS
jgi:hypothetical protein